MLTPAIDLALAVTEFGWGGTERYVEDLAIGLTRRGIGVAIIAESSQPTQRNDLTRFGIPVICIDADARPPSTHYFTSLLSTLRSLRPRILHTNVWRREPELRRAARMLDIAYITTHHHTNTAPSVRERLGMTSQPFAYYLNRLCYRLYPHAIISISALSDTNLKQRYGPTTHTTLVRLGVPEQTRIAPSGANGRAPRIVWAGSMIKRKNPLLAVSVLKQLLIKCPGAQMVMLGDGPLMGAVHEMASELGEGSLRLPGFSRDVLREMETAQLFLHTSSAEGTPYSILDAMSVGLPVVATNAGATAELVEDGLTGRLVTPDDPDGLTRAITSLCIDPELRAHLGGNAATICRAHFSLDRMISETIAAYRQLLGISLHNHTSQASA